MILQVWPIGHPGIHTGSGELLTQESGYRAQFCYGRLVEQT